MENLNCVEFVDYSYELDDNDNAGLKALELELAEDWAEIKLDIMLKEHEDKAREVLAKAKVIANKAIKVSLAKAKEIAEKKAEAYLARVRAKEIKIYRKAVLSTKKLLKAS